MLPNATEANERKLLDVVGDLARAAGIPPPAVFIMDGESGINAFTLGHTRRDAVIGVTRGGVQSLSPAELQGMLGHEFSHLLNGALSLNLRLTGLLCGLTCIHTLGRDLTPAGGEPAVVVPNWLLALVGSLVMTIGEVGMFFGRLMQATRCRQREFLADAAAVRFTHNPAGLSGALQKIGGHRRGSSLLSAHAPELDHVFFCNVLADTEFEPLATHPPLADRIRAIDPRWDGKFTGKAPPPAGAPAPFDARVGRSTPPPLAPAPGGLMGGAIPAASAPASSLRLAVAPAPRQPVFAEPGRESLPENLIKAAQTTPGATAIIYAMLLSEDAAMRVSQLAGLAQRIDLAIYDQTVALHPAVAAVVARAHLPLVDLALGTLGDLFEEDYFEFADALDWLIKSDDKIELFEFVLQKIVLRHLAPQFGRAAKPPVLYHQLEPLLPDCAVLLSALANLGSGDAAEVQTAFECGRPGLADTAAADLRRLPPEHYGLDEVDAPDPAGAGGASHQKGSAHRVCAGDRGRRRPHGVGGGTAAGHRRHAGLPPAALGAGMSGPGWRQVGPLGGQSK